MLSIRREDHTFHAQWFEHGSRTVLEEFAHPQELFLTNLCDDCHLSSVLEICSCSQREPGDRPKFFCDCDSKTHGMGVCHRGRRDGQPLTSLHCYEFFYSYVVNSLCTGQSFLHAKLMLIPFFRYVYDHVTGSFTTIKELDPQRDANDSVTCAFCSRYDEVLQGSRKKEQQHVDESHPRSSLPDDEIHNGDSIMLHDGEYAMTIGQVVEISEGVSLDRTRAGSLRIKLRLFGRMSNREVDDEEGVGVHHVSNQTDMFQHGVLLSSNLLALL